jgi:phosphoketolase
MIPWKRERERERERRRASKDAYNLLASFRELHACDMLQYEKRKFEVNGEEKEEEKSLLSLLNILENNINNILVFYLII